MQPAMKTLSIEELFFKGNYTAVAMKGDPDSWQTSAALGLIGKFDEALKGLSRFDHEMSRFYTGVVLWIAGDNHEAVKALSYVETPHARKLLKLITKPCIQVLSQLGWNSNSYLFLLSGATNDSKFEITNIGFNSPKAPNEIYADIHKYYNPSAPPDFYITQMLEWHLLPPNLQELPCPIFGQTGDYDLHIQTVPPWLQLFDDLIVTDHTEWQDVRHLAPGLVHTFPKSVSIPDSIPRLLDKERKIDFLMSGTIFHPYHPDKALLINQILDIPGLKSIIFNGFLSTYFEILQHTKISTTYVRHTAAMPSRGLEALAMGCALVVQEGNVINLFAGENEGVLTYDLTRNNVGAAFEKIISNWPEYERRARKGAEIIRRDFSSKTVASQYMRFLTYLAARPIADRRLYNASQLEQKRSILVKGWGCPHKVYKDLIKENSRRWTGRTGYPESPSDINNMARESILDFSTWAHLSTSKNYLLNDDFYYHGQLSDILAWYRRGTAEFPRSLILHFNMIRAALHFGSPKEVREALARAEIVVAKMESYWQLAPMDDVMPWDYFSHLFNYRGYFDLVTEYLKGSKPLECWHVRLILASIHYYLGHYNDSVANLEKAVALDPTFPFYRFRLALELLMRREADDIGRAVMLLKELVDNSMLFENAFPILEKAVKSLPFPEEQIDSFRSKYRRATQVMFTQNFQVDDWLDHSLRSSTMVDMTGIHIYPQTLTQLASSAMNSAGFLLPVSDKRKPKRILLIYFESTSWVLAQNIRYSNGLGLEEALEFNGIECLAIPAYSGISPQYSASWLHHARVLCRDREFDQVWIEMVNYDPGKEFLEWLSTSFPVRVAILPDSIHCDQEEYNVYPRFIRHHLMVEERLRYMTHALTRDEIDAEVLNSRGIVKALWTPDAVPAWCIAANVGTSVLGKAPYYEKECTWLSHPLLKDQFVTKSSPLTGSKLPGLFDTIHATVLTALHHGKKVDERLLYSYLAPIRSIRKISLKMWGDAIRKSPVSVNFPSLTKAYTGKVMESMAAGVPVVSWEIPNRPKTRDLFVDGEDILLFSRYKPEVLAGHLARLRENPQEGAGIALKSLDKIRRYHTLELRTRQVLNWIETGLEPSYGETVSINSKKCAASDDDLNSQLNIFSSEFGGVALLSVSPYQERNYTGSSDDEVKSILKKFEDAFIRRDVVSARQLLVEAVSEFPELNAQLAYFYLCTGDYDKSLSAYLMSLSIDAYNPDVLKNIGILSQRIGRHHEAARYIRTAMSSNPAADDVISLLEILKKIEELGDIPEIALT